MSESAKPRDHRSKYFRRKISLAKRHGKRCVYCRARTHHLTTLTLDHYIPRSKGGPNALTNLVLACPGCNQDKGSMLPLDFILARVAGRPGVTA